MNQFFYDPDYDTFSATTNMMKADLEKESHNLESKDKIKLPIAVKAALRYRQKLCTICKELHLAKGYPKKYCKSCKGYLDHYANDCFLCRCQWCLGNHPHRQGYCDIAYAKNPYYRIKCFNCGDKGHDLPEAHRQQKDGHRT